MKKELEFIYKEEYIRQKARHDFQKNQQAKNNSSHSYRKNFYQVLLYLAFGAVSLYIVYNLYTKFN